ncbi:hypothetical protein mRhiFer1_009351 [Rhinolophus ferrumequinum]|uniref:Reverse transcriptase/retrotransposon-derived protein RNase H-like domain-containing protein n=1 Tax=Rhinolophus ferrumequinum TaxID=59479 RepID=A0A7J7RXW4_RHIFE|nr:hypothetical protein mRhiFer1_009351 [Rhinolophus ferrumequinum]
MEYAPPARQQALSTEQKKVITSLPQPTNRRALCEFLGAAGFCQIWIPGFSAIARPLYEALTGQEKAPMLWTEDQEHAFQQLKSSLGQAPALGLPDAERPFHLFVHERDKIALQNSQTVGPWLCPTAYLSKKLDPVAAGWPPCLRALVATVILIKEADKLTLGQRLIVEIPHLVTTLMDSQGPRWLLNTWLTQYQGLLLENPRISLETVRTLNPATFMSTEEGDPERDCTEVISEVCATRPDLQDIPHPNPDLALYTDGSSFLRDRKCHAGYAVTSTDEVAIIHCWGHQRGNEPSAVENRLADTTAKSAAMRSPSKLLLVTDTTTTSLP